MTENTNPAANPVDATKIDIMVMRMKLGHIWSAWLPDNWDFFKQNVF